MRDPPVFVRNAWNTSAFVIPKANSENGTGDFFGTSGAFLLQAPEGRGFAKRFQ